MTGRILVPFYHEVINDELRMIDRYYRRIDDLCPIPEDILCDLTS
jgi:hypothetical protein